MNNLLTGFSVLLIWCGCFNNSENVVNVYTHRHYKADEEIYRQFTKNTGIRVNVIKSSADQLIGRLEMEGENTPADIFITVDAGRLWRAKEKGLLQPVLSDILINNIPQYLRDKDFMWFGLSYRARVIIYNKNNVKPEQLSTYEALASSQWKGKFLPRSSESLYNQSLLASFIAHNGIEKTEEWCRAMVSNFARLPKGNDTDIIKEIASGKGDVALINHYYLAQMFNSAIDEEKETAEKTALFFPNQNTTGTHINISGAALVKHSKHKANAIKLLEFLSEQFAQQTFTELNYEYPANEKVEMCKTLVRFGTFKADTLDLSLLGKFNTDAVKIFDRSGWY
jgi:iron(III) transport system substrate-binding protein